MSNWLTCGIFLNITKFPIGSNCNLDLHIAIPSRLKAAPIRVTSILNGLFTDQLYGQASLILKPISLIMYSADAD